MANEHKIESHTPEFEDGAPTTNLPPDMETDSPYFEDTDGASAVNF